MSEEGVSRARAAAGLTWAWLAVLGVFTVAVGVVALLAPQLTIAVLGVVLALWLLFSGLGRIGAGLAMGGWPGWRRALSVTVGVVLVVAGVTALISLEGSAMVLAYAIGLAFLLAGVADLAGAGLARASRRRWVLAALGAVNVVVAVVFLVRPGAGLAAIAISLGVALVVLGVAQLVGALALRRAVHRAIDRAAASLRAGDPGSGDSRVIRGEVL